MLSPLNSDLTELKNPEYVSVMGASGDTYGSLATKLTNVTDFTKLTPRSYIIFANRPSVVFKIVYIDDALAVFSRPTTSASGSEVDLIQIGSTVIWAYTQGNTQSIVTTTALPSTYYREWRLYYQ